MFFIFLGSSFTKVQHAQTRRWNQTEAWPSLKKMGGQVQEPKGIQGTTS
jgi:hypothetical protein